MDVLTRERAKPALPFAGTYRLVDFVLSSLSHSGIRDVWLSVQYQAGSLDSVVSGGRPWDLDRTRGGFRRVVPEQGSGSAAESGFSRGNADDLLRMRDDLERSGADVVLVASADHVFAMDLAELVDAHVSSGADATVVTADVGRDEARHNVVVHTRGATVTGVEVKPSSPGATTVATELFCTRSTTCGASWLRGPRATTAGSATSASTCCRGWWSAAPCGPCRSAATGATWAGRSRTSPRTATSWPDGWTPSPTGIVPS
jgi:glucose-1-phosphate adenylyltransferase